jgi:nucleoside-diphosphate-sugar epimerase
LPQGGVGRNLADMSILVTGGTGFIGAAVKQSRLV